MKKHWLSVVTCCMALLAALISAQPTVRGGEDPCPDTDTDTVCDDVDNCPATANTDQADADLDGAGDACDLECTASDVSATIVIDGCDTLVANATLIGGCTMADQLTTCVDARNHGQYVRCVLQLTAEWKRSGDLNLPQRGRIIRCAHVRRRHFIRRISAGQEQHNGES